MKPVCATDTVSTIPRSGRPAANSAPSAPERFLSEARPAPDRMAGKVDKTKKLEPVPKPDEKLYRDRIQAETTAIEDLKARIVRRRPRMRLTTNFSVTSCFFLENLAVALVTGYSRLDWKVCVY